MLFPCGERCPLLLVDLESRGLATSAKQNKTLSVNGSQGVTSVSVLMTVSTSVFPKSGLH